MPLRLLGYDVHLRLKSGLEVLPVVMVLTRSQSVVGSFSPDTIKYQFKLIRVWEVKGEELIHGVANRYRIKGGG